MSNIYNENIVFCLPFMFIVQALFSCSVLTKSTNLKIGLRWKINGKNGKKIKGMSMLKNSQSNIWEEMRCMFLCVKKLSKENCEKFSLSKVCQDSTTSITYKLTELIQINTLLFTYCSMHNQPTFETNVTRMLLKNVSSKKFFKFYDKKNLVYNINKSPIRA